MNMNSCCHLQSRNIRNGEHTQLILQHEESGTDPSFFQVLGKDGFDPKTFKQTGP